MSPLKRSYTIIGTGAVGGFYGACLQRAGFEVHFLVHSDYEHVRQHGLVIESKEGNFTLPIVHAYQDVREIPTTDVIIIALKATQNNLLANLLPPLVKDNSVILVLQNGLGVEEEIAQIVRNEPIIGGLCFLCSNKIGPGHIRHIDYKAITLAKYAAGYQVCGITEEMAHLAQDFKEADIPITLFEDLWIARWKKLVWNIPYNGLSVVLNATTQELMANINSRDLVEQLMKEVLLGAQTSNRSIPETFIQEMLDHTEKMEPYRTSMKIDYDEHRPMEVEAILGNPLRSARDKGIELSQVSMLYQQLKFLNARNILDRGK
ncbi:MAG: putative 2-dehydropantoate 2-reductase [Gloeobacterales cyanobacterium]